MGVSIKKIVFLFVDFKAILIILFLIGISSVNAINEITLVAVIINGDSMTGTTATLSVEVKPGTGRVFIDTYPLSKFDTQMSMRLAKQIACDYINKDCSNLDFTYIIRGKTSMITGPSAGAAATVITIAELMKYKTPSDVSMTGTINSGGIVGNVGGVSEKIAAAKSVGIKKILIPYGSKLNDNKTALNYSKDLGINIVEVFDLDSAIYEIYGKKLHVEPNMTVDGEYNKIMEQVYYSMCGRSNGLIEGVSRVNRTKDNLSISWFNLSLTKYENSKLLFNKTQYYSAASNCFVANVHIQMLNYYLRNMTVWDYKKERLSILNEINNISTNLNKRKLNTINDIQTYLIIKDRIDESLELLNNSEINDSITIAQHLGFSKERIETLNSWWLFFNKSSVAISVSNQTLKEICYNKIGEADERLQYALLYLPLPGANELLTKSRKYAVNGEYYSCFYSAAKAESMVNVLLGVLGIESNEGIKLYTMNHINHVKKSLFTKLNRNEFPIMAYSYYEYAESLKENDVFSALLYSEYALELSSMNIYFDKTKEKVNTGGYVIRQSNQDTFFILVIFASGALFGIIITVFFNKDKR